MISKLLIANRGEIAVRVIRTCKKLGIKTVAIYSDADRDSPHVKLADESVYVGEPSPASSYLNISNILEAIKKTKTDAVHPGYGFLSEKSEFAKALEKENVLFLGPSPESMELMGDKINSRIKMEASGVPVVPGYNGQNQDPKILQKEAEKIGYPLMIKATAGGGGKGMKRVYKSEEFLFALESAQREAQKAFGDGTVFLEKYVETPRHIEVQVFGDKHGNVMHLFERECSIQRRHQKVIEESPAPNLPISLRDEICRVAVKAAQSIGYVGAGTVEFILGRDSKFYFLEMNTRLQVEHPVTEYITDQDLVEWQIRVAEGKKLSELTKGKTVIQNGHAIEARIYAEDPENNFLPSTGILEYIEFPDREFLRVDTGVETGSEITVYYDPMIAKMIAWGKTREECTARLKESIDSTVIFGPVTNTFYLSGILSHEEFKKGNTHTHFLEEQTILFTPEKDVQADAFSFAAAALSEKKKSQGIWEAVGPGGFW
ncbi:acetyl-CoA carboxylase biotin carboxylase subunit [Leptospira interrogans]|uniref:Acetyl-CoA carboxylase biotin carboxylase subunit n=1 Tax=Leptospira interrogans TaxID=173 RepID=A0AAV9FZ73_LEPIR|nr:acetyl-CoA carboxylase biotin carboxylase subunit [Leptospira interrogans]KAK2619216.1 acetyl-CoA carboxylase biotin carboxylase subunit [Leptospira interrogans]MCR8648575.1 biotin carboxylase [Leptospira interrogans serovar Bataviae]OAM73851.1 biotin carboxylase [Leptospira interrogans serovar Bataviae]QOI39028.1 acetyl-CoA carboxylase biotin carboxylase subunit [Leptospira interrogans serovar Bataviae]QYY59310.1 acetyl-CoA carboxylase biotin carboxylase subunit [Leptospira interrogans ser